MMRLMVSAPITRTFLCVPAATKLAPVVEPVDEAAAGGDEIEAPGLRRAEIVLHEAGRGGEQHVRRDGADEDRVQFAGVDAALAERGFGGAGGEIGSGDVRRGDVALGDAGAVDDPFVVGLDHFFEIGIGQHAGRNVAPERGDFRF